MRWLASSSSLRMLLLTLTAVDLIAQTNVGSIFGHVSDSSGGLVAGASITLLDPATNEKTIVDTNERGDYVFNGVRPTAYAISAEFRGFKTAINDNVVLQVAEKIRVDFILEPGQLSQKVEVKGEAPLLQPGSSDIGTVINSRTIVDLPLEGRNIYELVTLVPGTTPNTGYGFTTNANSNLSGGPGIGLNQISINGGRNLLNEFLLDDVPNTTMGYNGVAIIPPVDAVLEFNVITNAPAAKFGRTGGGLTTVVTKSGTNQFHGDLWEFLRNNKLDANNFFANASGAPLPPFHQNQFGGTAGAPLIRNRTFVFGTYEGFRQAAGGQLLLTVPTDLQKRGDFSQTFRQDGTLFQIFDPFTTMQNPTTGAFSRQPFGGNVIPTNRFDPVSQNLLQYFPEPNLPGNPLTQANNFLSQAGFHNTTNFYLVRVDHNITDTQRIFARITYDNQNYDGSNVLGNIADFNSVPFTNGHKGLSLSYTNLLSAQQRC
jgi:Carboxypeptidase regulatory-like domain